MLSDAQQQLLHAWVDGEANDAETDIVMELLSQPAAYEYVSELKRLRELMAKHAGVNAPAGLLERVRDSLRREFSETPVIQLYAWRTAVLAAAAAIVVSLALVLGPVIMTEETPPEIAECGTFTPPLPAPEPMVSADPAPPPPGNPAIENPPPADVVESAIEKRAHNVLRLDRGVDQPLELSVHMNRERRASTLQVYNDMLIVSSLYGNAELQDNSAECDDDFAGRDFSEYDGVAIEVEIERVPELIAALNRMAADQAYGEVVVPNDLRRSIDSSAEAVKQLQGVTRQSRADAGNGPPKLGARSYLPPAVQRECLEQELKDMPDELQRLGILDDKASKGHSTGRGTSHKVRLLLRLR